MLRVLEVFHELSVSQKNISCLRRIAGGGVERILIITVSCYTWDLLSELGVIYFLDSD